MLDSCPITGHQVVKILVGVLLNVVGVVDSLETGIFLCIKVMNFDGIGCVAFDSNQAILFNGRGKNAVSFVIDVLTNDVDSTRGSCNEIGFSVVSSSKFLDQSLIPRKVVFGIKGLGLFEGDL